MSSTVYFERDGPIGLIVIDHPPINAISANNGSLQPSIESLQPNNGHGSACNGHCRVVTIVAGNKWCEYSVQRGIAGKLQVMAGLQWYYAER